MLGVKLRGLANGFIVGGEEWGAVSRMAPELLAWSTRMLEPAFDMQKTGCKAHKEKSHLEECLATMTVIQGMVASNPFMFAVDYKINHRALVFLTRRVLTRWWKWKPDENVPVSKIPSTSPHLRKVNNPTKYLDHVPVTAHSTLNLIYLVTLPFVCLDCEPFRGNGDHLTSNHKSTVPGT